MNSPLPAPTPPQSVAPMSQVIGQDQAPLQQSASSVVDPNDRPFVAQPPAPTQPQVPLDDDRPTNMFTQSLPTVLATDDTSDLNPPSPKPSAKEQVVNVVDQRVELPAGVTAVETEIGSEMPPEIEKYVEELKKHDEDLPQEVVISDKNVNANMAMPVAQPVIILPMTEKEVQTGKRAPVQSSTRWLAEFTEKIIKMFEGQVVFRQEGQA